MTRTIVRCNQVSRTFDAGGQPFQALRGVDLAIDEGELVAVTGASGSGKSTFLNVVGGLDRPSAGEVEVDGQALAQLPEAELASLRNRAIGFVFQQFNLLPRHTALRNVELPLVYAGWRRAQRRARAEALLSALGVAAQAAKLPAQMSGGQQQRVAIARALVLRPRLLLADEPTGALDSATSREVMTLLRGLQRDEGITVVIVTHDPTVAAGCDRVIRFSDGRVVEDSGLRTLRPAPRGEVRS
jgi:putative ABC transport system ATP-binding protein